MLEICPFSMIMEGIFYRKRCYERPWKNEETKNSPHMQGHTEWLSFPCICQLSVDEISEEQEVSEPLKPNSDRRFAEVIRIIFGLNRMNLYSNMILYSWGEEGPPDSEDNLFTECCFKGRVSTSLRYVVCQDCPHSMPPPKRVSTSLRYVVCMSCFEWMQKRKKEVSTSLLYAEIKLTSGIAVIIWVSEGNFLF